MTARKSNAYKKGLLAEMLAGLLLMLKGYRIVAWRVKTPVGEIDLIARRGKTLAFIEVKARRTLEEALGAVSPRMQGRIARAAQYYISQNPAHVALEMRFDLFALSLLPLRWRHLDNGWQVDS